MTSKNKDVELLLDLGPELHKLVAEQAVKEGVDINRYIVEAIDEHLEKKTKPIIRFNGYKELDEAARYWTHLLCLEDWYFTFKFVSTEEMREVAGEVSLGYCSPVFVRKAARIYILNDSKVADSEDITYCQECILVHELLHCTVPTIVDSDKKIESCYWELMSHQRLEVTARALIMVKYNLKGNWFVPKKN